jgi:UPF0271 protein
MAKRIDINSDMGESYGPYTIGQDKEVMNYITSANIGCGWHGGDPMVMDQTVKMAKEKGVGVGAHPGYPDVMGFGRRRMDLSMAEIENYVLYQIGALYAFCKAHGLKMQHVKAHGALGNLAMVDLEVAKAIARATARFDPNILFVVMPGTPMVQAAKEIGLPYVQEVFGDRVYNPDGTLQSRKIPGSVIHDPEKAARQALTMVKEGYVVAHDGTKVSLQPDTLCVHGDNPTALSILKRIREEITKAGIEIKPMGQK